MDKFIIKQSTSSKICTNRPSSDLQPGTSSKSDNNNRQSSNVHPEAVTSGNYKRPLDAQSTTVTRKTNESCTRQYSEDYLEFCFIKGTDDKPLCVICCAALSNESMKPSKLKRHLELKHQEYSGKPIDFFINKKRELIAIKKTMSLNFSQNAQSENLVLASYEISKLIAETGDPHTIAEKLIVPAMKASRICDKKQEKQVNSLTLSNNTVQRRIVEMADNIEETIIGHLNECNYFSLQVDESTDISDNANLMCFIKYHFENTTHEEFLFCKSLSTRTTAEEIFNLIDSYINANGIKWNKCVGLSNHGARAMTGARTGLFPRIKAVAPECVWVHCSIHREALAVKKMPLLLTESMQECVKFINFIKSRPLNSTIFSALCKEMGSEHEHLLLHCEVRWLSKGNVFKRLIELKEEVLIFLEQHPPTARDAIFQFKDSFHDINWLIKVAYLCDIFDFLNNLNMTLQGSNVTVFKVQEKVEVATKKLNLWTRRAEAGNYKAFTKLTELQKEYNVNSLPDEISAAFKEYLLGLEANLKEYFPPIHSNKAWIRNPFTMDMESETGLPDLHIESVPEQNAGDSRKRVRRFAFDYCFSEDATQDQIFETIENIVGTSLKNRNHSCVLAYGQTSSGKTHTMMGLPHDPGLTPRLCRRIFKYFEEGALNDEASRMKVSVSYLEIYNEKVADLLNDSDHKNHDRDKPLRVREHPKKGPYVEGLSQHVVSTDTELLERLEIGTTKRRVGSTTTNPRSSRSHSVFSVSCDGVKLHLVDLAGNERAGSRGYGPSRFREGANINKSLVALGNVISTLADQSRTSAHSRNKFVPYRDSVLTWLLKDTLQGNSNTVMIATVSPSSTYYSETVNTLRFGQRAKLIVYKPVIVEDSKEKTIRELRAEIARLRDLLRLSSQVSPSNHSEDQMNANHYESNSASNEHPKEAETTNNNSRENISQESTLTSSITTSLSEPQKHTSKTHRVNSDSDNSLSTLNSPQEEASVPSTSCANNRNNTTETLLPIMNVKSSVAPATPKKLKRSYSIDRTYETDNSKSFSSQESLQSPKHSAVSSASRKLSGGAPPVQPKQTALSLRRQSINRSNPSLKTITQKKLLAPAAKKLEKGVVTDGSAVKKVDAKTNTSRSSPHVKPRAQIVAAVTSRLYNKVNKKDIGTSTENLADTVKEPRRELSICTNARNRLRELTQRALKAHKSKNEETQTDLFPILRVKEVATDCSDLKHELSEVKDASTLDKQESKDAEVECTLLNQFIEGTLKNILVLTRSCGIQATADEKSSVSFTKYLTETPSNPIFTEAVNINISHNYINGNRTGSLSDDSLDNQRNNVSFPTPDLISNHNSLEQHALSTPDSSESSEESIESKVCYAENSLEQDSFENVTYMPSNKVCGSTASVLTVPYYRNNFKSVDILTARAPEVVSKEPMKERCQSLPDFCPKKVRAKLVKCCEIKCDGTSILYHKPVVHMCQECHSTDGSSETSESDGNFVSSVPDSMEYHMANNKKVQFARKSKKQKNERVMKAMKEFLEEAKLLMTNIGSAANGKCQQPHLEDFDIEVTVNDVSGFEKTQRKRRRKLIRESNGTQTDEPPSMESCFSQTALDFPEYMLPINKYETLLEDSCKRLEEKIKKAPRSRHISITSDDYDDDLLFERLDRPKYNPWDLSNVEIEDSSLESNPVTFSDYGSLPRKTHKRQRTPTCSPSAFLKQLTHMRRQIIESSREELLQGGSASK